MEQTSSVPHHVVIIPDGNRRYAALLGREPWYGHEMGAKNTEALIKEAHTLGVKEISFWGSSLENLRKRPGEETRELLRIYETYFKELLGSEDVHKNQVRVRIIGRWREQFPEQLKQLLVRIEEETKSYDKYGLNFLLAYSGDDEMLQAINSLISAGYSPDLKITGKDLKNALMTKELPPVDYLIRTGGDPHLSAGFMMWDMANAELFFAEQFYPDFGPEAFKEALFEYSKRARLHGK